MSPKTVLILGAGPRVGYEVGRKFKAEGYEVAVASRNPDHKAAEKEGFHHIRVDLVDVPTVEAAFAEIRKKLFTPNVVVYNG
jgi:NAD(P)-dependent dehydrogenase (short-subunit alcohol dehydrogenase family)